MKELYQRYNLLVKILIAIVIIVLILLYLVLPQILHPHWNWTNFFLQILRPLKAIPAIIVGISLYQIHKSKPILISRILTYKKRKFRGWSSLFIDMIPLLIVFLYYTLPLIDCYGRGNHIPVDVYMFFATKGLFGLLLFSYLKFILSASVISITLLFLYFVKGFSIGEKIQDKLSDKKFLLNIIYVFGILLFLFCLFILFLFVNLPALCM